MAAKKQWNINLVAVTQNFHAAKELYSSEDLVGLIFGIPSTNTVTHVVFVPTSQSLDGAIDEALSYLPPDVTYVGLAKVKGTPTSVEKPTRPETFSVDIPLQQLQRRDVKGLSIIRTLRHAESLCVPYSVVLKLSVPLRISAKELTSEDAKRSLTEWTDRLSQSRFAINGTEDFIESSSDKISLKKLVKDSKQSVVPCQAHSFWLPQSSHLVHVVLPDDSAPELHQKYQRLAHSKLNVPLERPVLRPSYSLKYDFQSGHSNRLRNPHEHIKTVPMGQIATVRGDYLYYHYMQDGFDDCGWGCAYRSFQTVWSWFLMQGYTDKPVPAHREIQQCLCDIGDKPEKFVGSRQWIGSMELSFCLETMMGPTSKILTTNTGAEVAEHARALLYHFDNNGCPVMIGGGQLAHTILGVDYNTRSGECRFLVLDPHYTGDESLETVLNKGWCAWKPASFWDKKAFYNLMLPITPTTESKP